MAGLGIIFERQEFCPDNVLASSLHRKVNAEQKAGEQRCPTFYPVAEGEHADRQPLVAET